MLSSRQIFILVLGALLALPSCSSVDIPYDDLREGDLVFRHGRSVVSAGVQAISKDGAYTHVGILALKDGNWCVIHAVPGEYEGAEDYDRVRSTPLEAFVSRKMASCAAFCHVWECGYSAALDYARRCEIGKVPFDHSFDMESSDELYCTEFVRNAYLCQGLDLSEGCTSVVPVFGLKVLLPSDMACSPLLSFYYKCTY